MDIEASVYMPIKEAIADLAEGARGVGTGASIWVSQSMSTYEAMVLDHHFSPCTKHQLVKFERSRIHMLGVRP